MALVEVPGACFADALRLRARHVRGPRKMRLQPGLAAPQSRQYGFPQLLTDSYARGFDEKAEFETL